MARKATGTLEWRGDACRLRLSLPDGTRPRILLGKGLSQARAEDMKAAYLEKLAKKTFVSPAQAASMPARPVLTVRQLGKQWTSGELYEQYGAVNKLRPKVSGKIDAWTLEKHVYNVRTRGPKELPFGDLPVCDVTSDDCAAVMAAQPKTQAAQTRLHTYLRLSTTYQSRIADDCWRCAA